MTFKIVIPQSRKAHPGCVVYNLGTGTGYSVFDMVKAFEKACGKEIKYKIGPRREGDIGACYAKPDLARDELDWVAAKGLEEFCAYFKLKKKKKKWQASNHIRSFSFS